MREAVKFRQDTFGPKFGQSMVALAFMMIVMWVEPTLCGMKYPPTPGWFAKVGGHIWFDVSLFFLAWTSLQNALADKDDLGTMPAKAHFY